MTSRGGLAAIQAQREISELGSASRPNGKRLVSRPHPVLTDRDVRRIAVEVVRSGGLRGLSVANLTERAFDDYVVDRFDTPQGGRRIYLRPKVPFGAKSA